MIEFRHKLPAMNIDGRHNGTYNNTELALPGIVDSDCGYKVINFSPRFPVTPYTELRYLTGYEKTDTVVDVDVKYILTDIGMRYDITSPAERINAHILLPKDRRCKYILVNGVRAQFESVKVAESNYVDAELTADKTVSMEIIFD